MMAGIQNDSSDDEVIFHHPDPDEVEHEAEAAEQLDAGEPDHGEPEHGEQEAGEDGTLAAVQSLSQIMFQQIQLMQEQFQLMQKKEQLQQSSSASGDSSVRNKLPKPVAQMMTYDGTTSWLEYETYIEEYGNAVGWSSEKKAQYLCLSLRGNALGVLMSINPEDRKNFQAVKRTLKQHFCPEEKVHVYRAELQARKLKKSEDLADLMRDIQNKARLAYPGADPSILETLMCQYFQSSLTDKGMRLSVTTSHPKNLAEALAFATEYESIMAAGEDASDKWTKQRQSKADTESGDPETGQPDSDSRDQTEKLLDKIAAQLEALAKKGNGGGKKKKKDLSQVKCYGCQEMGHYANKCPKKSSEASSGNQ